MMETPSIREAREGPRPDCKFYDRAAIRAMIGQLKQMAQREGNGKVKEILATAGIELNKLLMIQ